MNKNNHSTSSISAINAFNDNYIWAIVNNGNAALVDPGDADVCIAFIEKNQLTLNTILITHHHADHIGGIEKLTNYCKQKQWHITIYGPANENIPHCNVKLIENDIVQLPDLKLNFTVIDLPGHTAGHIAYFTKAHVQPVVFCGDTLFSGGCGRLFEGSPAQMLTSLTKLANLPENTQVYCAHEYTQANLKFALTVEPNNPALKHYSDKVNALRQQQQSTIPTSIEQEKHINPFLRSHIQAVQQSAMEFDNNTKTNSLQTFTTIRRWKDQF